MAIIEAGSDQKQGFQVRAVLEVVVLYQVLQLPVLVSTEVRGQPFKQRRNRQLFVVGHGDSELCGQVFQTVQHICPAWIIGLGDLGDVGLPIAGMVFVEREGIEQCLDDGSNAVEHENARAFVVVVCHAGSFREERSQPLRTMASAGNSPGPLAPGDGEEKLRDMAL